jgi:hypothetical protein
VTTLQVTARSILATLAVVFAALSLRRLLRTRRWDSSARTWTWIALVFAVVSALIP